MADTPGYIVTGLASLLAAIGFQKTMFRWQDNKINDIKNELSRKQNVELCENISEGLGDDMRELKTAVGNMAKQVNVTNTNLAVLTESLENWKSANKK